MTTTYPSGYGTRELELDALMDLHLPPELTLPEFRRRIEPWIESREGLIGFGDILPRPWDDGVSFAAATNRSFHQRQGFEDGQYWCSAIDLVVRRPGAGHSSWDVPWSRVPKQGSAYSLKVGLHINVPRESWHMQCIEMDGFGSWVARGRRYPDPNFPLPNSPSTPTFEREIDNMKLITPYRVIDTRVGGQQANLHSVKVATPLGVNAVDAAIVSIVVVSSSPGFASDLAGTSFLNYGVGHTNMVLAMPVTDGAIHFATSTETHIVVDVRGTNQP